MYSDEVDLLLTRSFVATADARSITVAARELVVSQSALSRRLQQLERDLGVTLFIRSREGVELTAVGHEVLATSRRLIDQYELMRRNLTETAGLERGMIRIGGGATATSFVLPACVASFRTTYPGVKFYVREAGSNAIAADVAEGRLDLGIVTTPVTVDRVALEALLDDRIVLIAPSNHPLTRRTVTPADIDGTAIVGFESGSAIRHLVDSHLAAAGLRVDVVAELRSIPTMLNMVRDAGIPAFVSSLSVGDAPDLAEIRVRDLSITRNLAIANRQHVDATPAAAAFIELLHRTRAH